MKTCGTCAHSSKPADKMGANGWLRCAHGQSWNYRAPQAACSFDPVRWAQKAAKK
jgi:hypothetical protein